MIDITTEQIAAAKANDMDAVRAVFLATDERIQQIANRAATSGGRTDHQLAEDLAQDGREALWKALDRFDGASPAEFFTFLNTTVSGALADRRKAETQQGVSVAVAKRFAKSLAVDGDHHAAEQRCIGAPLDSGMRMSPEMARAARLSWQGAISLDAPLSGNGSGFGAGSVHNRGGGVHKQETPADRLTYNDERDRISDEEAEARATTRERVRETLATLPQSQEALLSLAFGIGDFPMVGGGDLRGLTAADYREIADVAGVATVAVDGKYAAAKGAFRTSYLGGAPEVATEGETKECRACERVLPLSEFHVVNKRTGNRRNDCKVCKRAANSRNKKARRVASAA